MEAKEYFEKHYPIVKNESEPIEQAKRLHDMFLEMADEMQELVKERRIKFDPAFRSLLKEQNQKWNAIANLFAKSELGPVVQRNGFENMVEHVMRS